MRTFQRLGIHFTCPIWKDFSGCSGVPIRSPAVPLIWQAAGAAQPERRAGLQVLLFPLRQGTTSVALA